MSFFHSIFVLLCVANRDMVNLLIHLHNANTVIQKNPEVSYQCW